MRRPSAPLSVVLCYVLGWLCTLVLALGILLALVFETYEDLRGQTGSLLTAARSYGIAWCVLLTVYMCPVLIMAWNRYVSYHSLLRNRLCINRYNIKS